MIVGGGVNEAGPVVVVDRWWVLVLVLAAWLAWAVSAWQKARRDRDRVWAKRHRIEVWR